MDIVKTAASLVLLAVFCLLPVWLARRKKVPGFDYWMKTEGAPILGGLLAWFAVLFVATKLLQRFL